MSKYLNKIVIFSVISICCFQIFYKIGDEQIKIWDEARGALNAIEMTNTKDFIVVTCNYEPDGWNTKPPLSIWLKYISYKIFGINEFAVRIPSAIASLLTIFLILWFTYKELDKIWIGIITVLLLISTKGYLGYHVVRNGEPDSLLILFVTAYTFIFYKLLKYYPEKRIKHLVLFGLALMLAIYTKSIAGVAPLAGLFLYAILHKKSLKLILDYRFYLTMLSVLVAVFSYYYIRNIYEPGYILNVLKVEIGLFNDYFVGKPKHPEFSFYFKYLRTDGFKVFFYFLPLSIIPFFISKNQNIKKFLLLCICMALALFFGYSSSVTKNEWYISPIFVFLCLMSAISIYSIYEKMIEIKILKRKLIITNIVSLIIIISIITPSFIKVFKINTEERHVYTLEREGLIFREFKKNFPEIKDITVVTTYKKLNLNQLQFYTEKYRLIDSTNTEFTSNTNNLLNKTIIISDYHKELNDEIATKYSYDVLFKDKYSKCLYINGIKNL